MKSKLTVATTTYNQEKYIEKALEGFVSQKTDFPFEVVISDDLSTDNTVEIIKKYAKKYPEIIKPIFNKINKGPMKNFVDTLDVVTSEYVAFCDGDDYWCDENKLQNQVDFLDSHPDYSVCFHQTKIFFENNEKPEEIYPSSKFPKTTQFDDLLKQNYIPANTVVYRWKFDEKKKLSSCFPKDIVPGDYFIHLIHANAGKIYFINKVMSCYRRHSGGMWWLSSQDDKKDDFTLKYGILYFNFFKSVEEYFNLDKKTYKIQKDYLANDLVRVYASRGRLDELFSIWTYDRELFNGLISRLCSNVPVYDKLSTSKKIAYAIFIEPSILKNKLISKTKNVKLLNFAFRGFRYIIRKIKRIKVENVNNVK